VHDGRADDEPFLQALRFVERAASDERNFVKKAVKIALRAIRKCSPALNAAAVTQRIASTPPRHAEGRPG
jgi:3-methyladenine DNA glycosylase AlkD